ncbi:MAG: hemolysin family protein [Planctomycetota bacterium]
MSPWSGSPRAAPTLAPLLSAVPAAGWQLPPAELPTVDLAATITPALVGLSLLCLSIATFGALGTSTLAVYSPTKLQNRRRGEVGQALVADLERREREFRVVARFYLMAGLVGALLSMQAGVDAATAPWAMGSLVVLALLLCGSLPSAIADVRAEATLLRILPILRGGLLVLRWPLVLPVLAVTGGILRVLRIREEPSKDTDEITEQVLAAVADSVTEDALAGEERAWIGNIIGLKDLQVSTIMTPRPDLVALQADTPVRDAVRQALEHGFSRYPVYRERIDEIVGIFYVKDALALVQGDDAGAAKVETMMRPPLFVPESMAVPQLLQRLQADKVHIAVVLDEYGTTAGLVSVEDALEEIVGDINDEYDAQDGPDPDQVTVVENGHVVEVPGRLSVDEVNQLLGLDLPDDGDWETVAGFVIHNLNRIPATDETVRIDGVEFHVLRADERRVDRLRVTAPAPEPANRDA